MSHYTRLPDAGPSDPREVLLLARRLSEPGSRALLITEDNQPAGRTSLEEAVVKGRAFAVKPAANVLAVDCDRPKRKTPSEAAAILSERTEALKRLAKALWLDGFQAAIIRSGRPGNLHLWAVIDDPEMLAHYKQRAQSARLDVRSATMMRPPIAAHRLGLPTALTMTEMRESERALRLWVRQQRAVEIVATHERLLHQKSDAEWVRNIFRHTPMPMPPPRSQKPGSAPKTQVASKPAPVATKPRGTPRPLSPEMAILVLEGLPKGQRSSALGRLALWAVQAGWTVDRFYGAVTDPTNGISAKVREKRPVAARQYVEILWREALATVAERPASAPTGAQQAEALARLTEVREAMTRHSWPGRGGATEQILMAALCALVEKTGRLPIRADVRTLGDMVGVCATTALRVLNRLRTQGWVVRVEKPNRELGIPPAWDLRVGRGVNVAAAPEPTPVAHPAALASVPPPVAFLHLGVRENGADSTSLPQGRALDVFRARGLGHAKGLIWAELDAHYPRPARDIAKAVKRKLRIVQRHLSALAAHGLAVRTDGGWLLGAAHPHAVAEKIGIAGTGQRQHQRHKAERERFKADMVEGKGKLGPRRSEVR